MSTTDIVGYIGTIFVIVSFLMKNMVRLRIINALGCSIFVVYGFLLDRAWPIIITNVIIVIIQLIYLVEDKKNSHYGKK